MASEALYLNRGPELISVVRDTVDDGNDTEYQGKSFEILSDFAILLKEAREAAGVSQSKLGEAAGFDHSYISRLESGARVPSRDAVERVSYALADRLGLSEEERNALKDKLLLSAGFVGKNSLVSALSDSEPELAEVYEILRSQTVSKEVKESIRANLGTLPKLLGKRAVAGVVALPEQPKV